MFDLTCLCGWVETGVCAGARERAMPTIQDALAESCSLGKRANFPGWKSDHHRPFPSVHRCTYLAAKIEEEFVEE